jgi:hypothetical protein
MQQGTFVYANHFDMKACSKDDGKQSPIEKRGLVEVQHFDELTTIDNGEN